VKQAYFALILFALAPTFARAQDLTAPSTPHVADPEAEPPPAPPQGPALTSLPEGAHATTPGEVCPALPQAQTHDGFYIRLQTGLGYMSARRGGSTFSGDAFSVGVAVGAIIVPDLALFGTFLLHEVRNPTANQYGAKESFNGTLRSESFGAGLAYYFEPVNVYVATALMATSALVADGANNKYGSANRGLGAQVLLAKEWWVGREWGVGVAAEFTAAVMTDTDDHSTQWKSYTYSLLFSATYN
jgi:hypothetical protein